MFGKVLLLALVCVAATEVRGNDLECNTEEALRRADNIFQQIASCVRYVVDLYIEGYWVFEKIGETSWGIIWGYAYGELKELENASVELANIAREQSSPKEVFICISEKTQKANEVLRVMPWAFKEKFESEIKKYYNERSNMVAPAQNKFHTYLDYYRNNIVKGLKECDTNECLEEILSKYEDEYQRMNEEYAGIIKNMEAQSVEFKDMAEARLSAAKGTFTFARVAGVNEIKKCLVASN